MAPDATNAVDPIDDGFSLPQNQPEFRTEGTRVGFDGDWSDVERFDELFAHIKEADSIEDWGEIFMGTETLPGHLNWGNSKIHRHVAIFSVGAASDCPNRFTENCQVDGDECYAVFTEQNVSPHAIHSRRRREYLWDCLDAETFADAFLHVANDRKSVDVTALRFNVATDVRYRGDALKIERIAERLDEHGIDVYLYTASSFVDWSDMEYTTVNASNSLIQGADREFKAVETEADIPENGFHCPNDQDNSVSCGECRACFHKEGDHDIFITKH